MELPKIDDQLRSRMKDEIRRCGRVLVPMVVDEHDKIIDGKLRWEIAQELGIRDVPRVIVPGLSEEEKHDLRLVINICRRHLSREQIRQWIAWELQLHPDHSDRVVAGRLGVSPTTVGKVRTTVQSGQSAPRLGADGKYRRPAVYTSLDRQSRQAQEILQSLHQTPQDAYLNLHKLQHLRRDQERAAKMASAEPVSIEDFHIINCDFRAVGERIKSHSVDVAIVDPPWAEWKALGRPLGRELCRILRPNGLACVYTGSYNEDQWNDALKNAGLVKEWRVIGLRNARNGTRVLNKTIRNMYTPIILYRNLPRGQLVTATMLADLLDYCEPEKDWDEWQKPVGESVQLLKFLSKPGDLIADLCVGSGTVPVATALVGERRRFVGCDIDETIVAAALTRVAQVLRQGLSR